MARRLRVPAFTFALLIPAALALGAPSNVDSIIQRANELRKSGDDQGALPLLREAYQVAPSPRTAIQLGLVECATGRWADADRHLTEGLRSGNDPFIQKNRTVLLEALSNAKQKVGSLDIQGGPVGADVIVNGALAGKLPLDAPVQVNAGTADVELRANGYRPQLRTVAVPAQNVQVVIMRLNLLGADRDGSSARGQSGASSSPTPESLDLEASHARA